MDMTRTLRIGALAGAAVMLMAGCSYSPFHQDERESVTDLFQCLDGNSNEYLEVGELQNTSACDLDKAVDLSELPDSRKRRAEAMITDMDIDGDERIGDREFRAWYFR
jgi:Ca2+-binding EF-hand superfamily protein